MEEKLSTMALCDKLDISRSWVNTHLRELGGAPEYVDDDSRVRAVMYPKADVIKWLNDHARCSCQTKQLCLLDYATEDEIQAVMARVKEKNKEDGMPRNPFQWALFELLPQEIFEEAALILPRKRGLIPWVEVDCKITSLEQLHSIRSLSGNASPELGYRQAYKDSMIRFEVDGRCWFIETEKDPREYCFLVPYGAEV